ncbi:hypothetical protein DFJ74DRAFT_678919 [Hyaloraphidium curvatum]|nr:hypothetical protein DFJ74DRAFT_678919 [Hyaloraphidium curvatum]
MAEKGTPIVDFTEPEWLAIVPSPAAPGASWLFHDSANDVPRPPLDRKTMLRELGRRSPLLRLDVKLHMVMVPWASRIMLRAAVWVIPAVIVVLSSIPFNDGRYTTASLAAGIVSNLWFVIVTALPVVFGGLSQFWKSFARGGTAREPDYNVHVLAGLIRWSQLVDEDSVDGRRAADERESADPPKAGSILLRHFPSDPLCPCAAPTCAGRLGKSASLLRLAEASSRVLLVTASLMMVLTTPLVVRAPVFWTSSWALPGALAWLAAVNYVFFNVFGRFSTNASLLRLTLRIQRRAMLLSLRSFFDRFEEAIFGGDGTATSAGVAESARIPASELYPKLHYRLASNWERRIPFLLSGRILLSHIFAGTSLPFIVDLAVGSCIPAYVVLCYIYILCVLITDLTHLSLSNEQIDAITELYRQAQTEIRDKLVRAQALPFDPERARLMDALREHDRLLASFREVNVFRAKFLGFVVDFAVLRTFLVTVFTVLVGLWSILRGSFFFTLDSMCPSR